MPRTVRGRRVPLAKARNAREARELAADIRDAKKARGELRKARFLYYMTDARRL